MDNTNLLEDFKLGVIQHEQKHQVVEYEFYPEHADRVESAQYSKVHKDLTIKQDLPCKICGVKNSTLKDSTQNPFGAKQLETHHCHIEWALANAVDVDKFNKTLRLDLAKEHPEKDLYKTEMTPQQVLDWVDHSEDNLWVLCDVHHRAKYYGIHEITFPIWSAGSLLKDDFSKWVQEEISKINETK